MKDLTSIIRLDREFGRMLETFEEQFSAERPLPAAVNGLSGFAALSLVCETVKEIKKYTSAPALILVSGESDAADTAEQMRAAGIKAAVYPGRELVFHGIAASHDTERERLSVLSGILGGKLDAVVTTQYAASLRTIPPELLSSLSFSLVPGGTVNTSELGEKLDRLGFAKVETVEAPGQYARRGGILDIWAESGSSPVRVEFFGDEIDRMGSFSPESQRVFENSPGMSLIPAVEVICGDKERERIAAEIRYLSESAKDTAKEELARELTAAENGLTLEYRDKYIGAVYPEYADLLTYIYKVGKPVLFFINTGDVRASYDAAIKTLSERIEYLSKNDLCPYRIGEYCSPQERWYKTADISPTLHVNSLSGGIGSSRLSGLFGFRCRRTVSYADNPKALTEDLSAFKKGLYRTLIAANGPQGVQSLVSFLEDSGITAVPVTEDFDCATMSEGAVYVSPLDIPSGYELITPKIALLSMRKDEGRALMRRKKQRRTLKKYGSGERILSYADLSVGDYVVHSSYGIGRFEGLQTLTTGGVTRDYITIAYRGADKLFLPADRLEMIAKYIGARSEDGEVKLSKLGGNDWNRAKSKAKAAAKDLAKDLIALYAERQRRAGYAFPPDSEIENSFAASFEFEETETQLEAIEEIKSDMERPVPMDRLLCGDVGFGKTEVALRAAFKAACAGKQTAILVPTTILALQHYQTTLSRMHGYPVSVDMLSRLCTPKEAAAVLRRVKRGETDILIGTHKLLGKNVEFHDLGLLIVDEEQRFGVAQKEKLKTIAKNVDVLTLTATPIPRTLNMAMSGIRDMSVLDEAPTDRRPVQTYVLEHDDIIIMEAIKKELARGGQVLYLYNRTENIDLIAGRINRDLPEARVAYAHGKMEKDELEDIWQSLVAGEIDILVCTTIIETGIDLPNANTLIIEDADRMGLSQLHQLRGRVGRSGRQAYAYFTYRRGKMLSEIARKRLEAIREYAEFGAGFKIALRDLEIRGAGNLLGSEQHGCIESVGYDMYVRLLNEAVLEEKGEPQRDIFEAKIDIAADANIPATYISSNSKRMEMYKKISLIRSREDLEDILDEFCDRFGQPPKETERLLYISLSRALASDAHIALVSERNGSLRFSADKSDLPAWSEIFAERKGLSFSASAPPSVTYKLKSKEDAARAAADILESFIKAQKTGIEKDEKNYGSEKK